MSAPGPPSIGARRILFLGAVLVAVSGCEGGPPEPPFEITPDRTTAGTPVPRSSFETPEPTPTPTLASNEVGIGENVGITRDGVSWAALTVSEVVVAGSFPNREGPGGDAPDRSGSVFVAAHVTVAALADTVSFELEGFRATVETGDEVTLAFSHLGPKPDLMPGTLEGRGDSASGWLLFEAPEAGRVRLFYDDGMATSSPLGIVLRGS